MPPRSALLTSSMTGPCMGAFQPRSMPLVVAAPEAHAARRQDRVGEGAVIDFDEVDTARRGPQGALVNGPVLPGVRCRPEMQRSLPW